ncbi:MAG: thrombospondin type 3 repeat-containing protein [Myxococcales bacterium]|nr:thrombospondin type 3 repeat-containing protein [Myxococcales bacterium]
MGQRIFFHAGAKQEPGTGLALETRSDRSRAASAVPGSAGPREAHQHACNLPRGDPNPARSAGPTSDEEPVFQLDRRIRTSVAAPLHPAGVAGIAPCHAGDATLVGYGPTAQIDPEYDGVRTFASSSGWTRNDLAPGSEAYWTNMWVAAPASTSVWYFGSLPGDSGGPLIQDGVVCGVTSRFTVVYVPVSWFGYASDSAALDSPANVAFLSEHLLDSKGRFKGECDEGPLEGRDLDSDNDLIPDSCDVCPNWPVRDPATVTAEDVGHPIGLHNYKIDGVNNYDLSGGADPLDQDGVPIYCDNCPMDANPMAWNLAGHRQADSDGDGLGDACDTCAFSNLASATDMMCCASDSDCGPNNACIFGPGAPGSLLETVCEWGRCARSVDMDNDGIGDTCDNCPGVPNADQADRDHDGVGDLCDNCPGSLYGTELADVNPPCAGVGDSYCEGLKAGSRCVPAHRMGGWGLSTARCTLGRDDDGVPGGPGDGVGDACDNCPSRRNPFEGNFLQPNCNVYQEIVDLEPYPYLGDACDPTPCAALDAWEELPAPEVSCPGCEPPPEPPPAPHSWVKLAYEPNLLPQYAGGYVAAGAPTASVGTRACQCHLGTMTLDDPMAVLLCDQTCPIGTAYYANPIWAMPNMMQSPSAASQPPAGAPDPADFAPSAELAGLGVVSPVPNGFLPFGYAPDGTQTGWADWDVGTVLLAQERILWTHTLDVTAIAAQPWQYTPRSNHHVGGVYGYGLTPPSIYGYEPIDWVPWLTWDVCPECPVLRDTPILMVQPSEGTVVAAGADRQIDLTSRLPPALIGELTNSATTRFVAVAEPRGWLDATAVRLAGVSATTGAVRFALAPRGPMLLSVVGAGAGGGETDPPGGAEPRDLGPSSLAEPVATLSDFGVVLSARERGWPGRPGRLHAQGATLRHPDRSHRGADAHRRQARQGARGHLPPRGSCALRHRRGQGEEADEGATPAHRPRNPALDGPWHEEAQAQARSHLPQQRAAWRAPSRRERHERPLLRRALAARGRGRRRAGARARAELQGRRQAPPGAGADDPRSEPRARTER